MILLLLISLTACKEDIVHDLTETDANKILSELNYHGIDSSKSSEGDGKWQISVNKEDRYASLDIVNNSGLGVKKNIKKISKSLIQTDSEANDYRVSQLVQGLEESLNTLSGVISVSVHLNMPLNIKLQSASVLLVVKDTEIINKKLIEDLLIGATGLSRNQITVLITPHMIKQYIKLASELISTETINQKIRICFLLSLLGIFLIIILKIIKIKEIRYGN